MPLDREEMADWFPVYLRYLGSLLGCVLVFATIFGRAGIDYAGAYVLVTGMIAYKSIHDYGRTDKRIEEKKESEHADRWSHLDGPTP